MTPFSKLTLLHCADLHLSASHNSASSKPAYGWQVFEELCAQSVIHNVHGWLLCGDIFETYQDAQQLIEPFCSRIMQLQMEFLARGYPLAIWYIPGNHELLKGHSFSDLASMLTQLSQAGVSVARSLPFECFTDKQLNLEVLAIPFQRKVNYLTWDAPPPKQARWRIGLLHGEVSGMCHYLDSEEEEHAAIDPHLFAQFELDYAALGHIHKRREQHFGTCLAHYPGSPLVWRKGESGPRYATLVHLDSQGISTDNLPIVAAGQQHVLQLYVDQYAKPVQLSPPQPYQPPNTSLPFARQALKEISTSLEEDYHSLQRYLDEVEHGRSSTSQAQATSPNSLCIALHGMLLDPQNGDLLKRRLAEWNGARRVEIDDSQLFDISALQEHPLVQSFEQYWLQRWQAAQQGGDVMQQKRLQQARHCFFEYYQKLYTQAPTSLSPSTPSSSVPLPTSPPPSLSVSAEHSSEKMPTPLLREIYLKQFGCFSERRWQMAPLTVFYGPNQSGKTTLFDAIQIGLQTKDPTAKDAGAKKRKSSLPKRFGRYDTGYADNVEISWQALKGGSPPFYPLLSVAEGHLELSWSADGLARLRQLLFQGGIDPSHLKKMLSDVASTDGRKEITRKLNECQQQVTKEQASLRARQFEHQQGIDALTQIQVKEKQIKTQRAVYQQKKTALASAQTTLQQAEQRAKWEHLTLQQERLQKLQALQQWQQDHRLFATDLHAKLKPLQAAVEDQQRQVDQAKGALNNARQNYQSASEQYAKYNAQRPQFEAWQVGHQAVNDAWRAGHTHCAWIGWFAGVSMGLAAVLLGVQWLSSALSWWLGIGVFGMALIGSAVWVCSKKRLKTRLIREWERNTNEHASTGIASQLISTLPWSEWSEVLGAIAEKVQAWLQAIKQVKQALNQREESLKQDEQSLKQQETIIEKAKTNLQDWLRPYQVKTSEEYIARIREYQSKQETAHSLTTDVERALQAMGIEGDVLVAQQALTAQQAAFEVDIADLPLLKEAALVDLQSSVKQQQQQQQQQDADLTEQENQCKAEKNLQMGALQSLPAQIADADANLQKKQEEKDALEQQRDAAKTALDLFETMELQYDQSLQDLSKRIGVRYAAISMHDGVIDNGATDGVAADNEVVDEGAGAIAGETIVDEVLYADHAATSQTGASQTGNNQATADSVQIADLEKWNEQTKARDQQGLLQTFNHLSTGTQRLLLLIMRLELGQLECGTQPTLVCLDEPFAFLDAKRQLSLLRYVKDIQQELGWQIVVFTSDSSQTDRVRQIFPDMLFHQLGE